MERIEYKEMDIKDINILSNRDVTKDDISDLMNNIEHTGLLQPLGIFKSTNDKYPSSQIVTRTKVGWLALRP